MFTVPLHAQEVLAEAQNLPTMNRDGEAGADD